MLSLLVTLPEGVNQTLVEGEKTHRLIRSISYVDQASVDATGMWTLWLYQRDNPAGMNEFGLVYEAGPNWQDIDAFDGKMLRFFSLDDECYEVALSLYERLVEEYDLELVDIARIIELN